VGPIRDEKALKVALYAGAEKFAAQQVLVEVKPGAEATAEIVLVAERKISGRVLTADGVPVSEARLEAAAAGGSDEPIRSSEVSDDQGAFTIGRLSTVPVRIVATHPTWGRAELEVTPPAEGVTIKMQPGCDVEVTVVDEKDRPQRWAVALLPDQMMAGRQGTNPPDEPREGTTDRDGKTTFHGLKPGPWIAVAGDSLREVRSSATVELKAGEKKTVKLVAREGLKIEGVVVDYNGKPVPKPDVRADPLTAEAPTGSMRTSRLLQQMAQQSKTVGDADGRFTLQHLQPGKYRLSAGSSFRRGDQTVEAEAGAVGVRITIPAQRIAVGRVIDEQGQPVPRFRVNDKAVAELNGAFRVDLAERASGVSIAVQGRPSIEVPLPAKGEGGVYDFGTIQLQPGRSVTVTVIDGETNRPMPNVAVGANLGRLAAPSVATGEDGTATLENLPGVGAVTVFAVAADRAAAMATLSPGQREVRLVLEMGGTIEGIVRFVDGGVASWANVALRAPDGGEVRPPERPEQGGFRFTGVPTGTWELRADLGVGALKLDPIQVTVAPKSKQRIEIREPAGGVMVTLNLVDAQGEPGMAMMILVPGIVAAPASYEDFRTFNRLGQRLPPRGGAASVRPGDYTLVGLVAAMVSDRMSVFTERVIVTSQQSQTITVRIPPKMIDLPPPKR
jgi:hypothetical protein